MGGNIHPSLLQHPLAPGAARSAAPIPTAWRRKNASATVRRSHWTSRQVRPHVSRQRHLAKADCYLPCDEAVTRQKRLHEAARARKIKRDRQPNLRAQARKQRFSWTMAQARACARKSGRGSGRGGGWGWVAGYRARHAGALCSGVEVEPPALRKGPARAHARSRDDE